MSAASALPRFAAFLAASSTWFSPSVEIGDRMGLDMIPGRKSCVLRLYHRRRGPLPQVSGRRSPNPARALLCSVEHLDRRDVVDEASARLVTRRHDLRRPFAPERLSVVFIGDNDLIAAEARVDLSRGED